jgi:hypothetical protein
MIRIHLRENHAVTASPDSLTDAVGRKRNLRHRIRYAKKPDDESDTAESDVHEDPRAEVPFDDGIEGVKTRRPEKRAKKRT